MLDEKGRFSGKKSWSFGFLDAFIADGPTFWIRLTLFVVAGRRNSLLAIKIIFSTVLFNFIVKKM